jgi:succinate dehydrogenase / fumarate reductase cytochrome b subunit
MAAQTERPLSPFMTYRWTLTMIMSIIHRVTGLGLYAGTLLMAWWLIATASSPAAYACLQSFTSSWIGRLVEIGFTWSLLHHAFSGLRYLVWDTGHGFGVEARERLTQAALIAGVVATAALWIGFYLIGAGQ